MKAFSPAGMAQKAYYGRGARTFGNPGGATSGNGSFNGGGGSPTTPTLVVTVASGGGGAIGWEQTFCGVPVFGVLVSGGLPGFLAPGTPAGIGTNIATSGPPGFSFLNFGNEAQNSFATLQIIELGLTLTTATADFFTNGGGCGPDAVWTWIAVPPLVVGNTYSFVFA